MGMLLKRVTLCGGVKTTTRELLAAESIPSPEMLTGRRESLEAWCGVAHGECSARNVGTCCHAVVSRIRLLNLNIDFNIYYST